MAIKPAPLVTAAPAEGYKSVINRKLKALQRLITDHHEFRKTTESMLDPKYTQKFSVELQGLAKRLAHAMMEVYKEVESKTQDHLKS